MDVYVEKGGKRVFAGALEWPGYCRSARDEDAALQTLLDYAPRYRKAVRAFATPKRLVVVERHKGDATTDFGAPAAVPSVDEQPVSDAELKRLLTIWRACWRTFDATAERAKGKTLAAGPRGGGRDVARMRDHVFEADAGYLRAIGGAYRGSDSAELRKAMIEAVKARLAGEIPDVGPRGGKRWAPLFAIRRSAWHALDHAWEIEDRLRR
jgi:hypothetical protein